MSVCVTCGCPSSRRDPFERYPMYDKSKSCKTCGVPPSYFAAAQADNVKRTAKRIFETGGSSHGQGSMGCAKCGKLCSSKFTSLSSGCCRCRAGGMKATTPCRECLADQAIIQIGIPYGPKVEKEVRMVLEDVMGGRISLTTSQYNDRRDRINACVREPFYHQTDFDSTRAIIQSNKMLPGHEGIAGGGIYFATNIHNTFHKAKRRGYILKVRLKLGVTDNWQPNEVHTDHTGEKCLAKRTDSVLIPRSGGDEYIVYFPDQVQLLEAAISDEAKSSIKGPFFSASQLRGNPEALQAFLAREPVATTARLTGL